MGVTSVLGMKPDEAVGHIGRLTEVSLELGKPDGLRRAILLAEEMLGGELTPGQSATLHYFISNAWENLRILGRHEGNLWAWEQEPVEKGLLSLRHALGKEAVKELPRERVSSILSNMAAMLNHVGRFSEAMECWDRALSVSPSFALARGKKGYALTHYSHAVYDAGQAEVLLKCAYAELKTALSLGLRSGVSGFFEKRLSWIELKFPGGELPRDLDLHASPEISSEEEAIYRNWCLKNRLFLNPLNDIGPFPIGARDMLNIPPWVRRSGGGAYFHGFYNQMKQAYVSARYLYYEGVNTNGPHFSDRDVTLFDTLDYTTYSLAVEKVKASFRIAYSLFGKVAMFLNQYMRLRIPEERLTFRTLWYGGQSRPEGLRPEFRDRRNWPLRGLFWLSKDLYEKESGAGGQTDPDSRELSEILYHMDNRYLNLYEKEGLRPPVGPCMPVGPCLPMGACSTLGPCPSADTNIPPSEQADLMAFSVQRGDFEAKTLRALKMARSALLYLSLAVHMEEKARRKAISPNDPPTLTLMLDYIDDSIKL